MSSVRLSSICTLIFLAAALVAGLGGRPVVAAAYVLVGLACGVVAWRGRNGDRR